MEKVLMAWPAKNRTRKCQRKLGSTKRKNRNKNKKK